MAEKPGLSNELRLLLLCAAVPCQAGWSDEIRRLCETPLQWSLVIQLGLIHGLMPLLHRGLCAAAQDAVPPATLKQLTGYAARCAERNRQSSTELLRILGALRNVGIEATSFKGAVAGAWLFGDISLREFADLDILVRQRDVLATRDVLVALGYHAWKAWLPQDELACLRIGKDYPMLSADEKKAVEIHWRFAPTYFPFPVDVDSLWPRLRPRLFEGTAILETPPEDLLPILCLHGTRHQWDCLKWVCDIAALIHAEPGMNWDRVVAETRNAGSQRMVLTGLLLASDLFRARLPESITEAIIRDRASQQLARQVRQRIAITTEQAWTYLDRWCFAMNSRERLRDRLGIGLHFVRHRLKSTRDEQRLFRLPPSLRVGYQFVRGARLLIRYGFSPVRSLLRSLVTGKA